MRIDATGLDARTLNQRVREALAAGAEQLVLNNVCGQRYIGAGLVTAARLTVNGTPGNDLGCFMEGARLIVRGNVQDGVANTMSSGEIIVHGSAGDVLGYAMRGGRVLVRGDAGYRVGIHMKSYENCVPVIVIGGGAGDYLGEYMAGGMLVVLGLGREQGRPLVGRCFGTGMHGGEIFVRGSVDEGRLGREVGAVAMDGDAWGRLEPHLADFAREFGVDPALLAPEYFTRLAPVSHRPYGKIYAY